MAWRRFIKNFISRRYQEVLKKLSIFVVCGLIISSSGISHAEESRKGISLEKVIVTPSRLEQEFGTSSASVSVLNSADLEELGALEVTEALDTLPSVNILNYGSSGSTKSVHTRGASSAQVLTLLDGVPVNTPRDGETDFNKIPLANIERIELMRGPASSIYGAGAVGGVINIITKTGHKDFINSITTKSGSHDTYINNVTTGGREKNFDYLFFDEMRKSCGHREHTAYKANNFFSKIGYNFNPENRVTLSGKYYESETETPGKIVNLDLDDSQETKNSIFDMTYKGTIANDVDVLVKGYSIVDRLDFFENEAGDNKNSHQTKVYGLDAQVSAKLFDLIRSTFGISGQENRLNSSNSSKHTYNVKAAFFETSLEPNEDLAVKFGARVDDYSNFGDKISPSTSFMWWPKKYFKLHGLYGKSFRAPTFNDLYWPREDWGIWGGVEGSENLSPETTESYEIGSSLYLFESIFADITYFRNEFDGLINWTVDNAYWWRPENTSSAMSEGVDVNLDSVIKTDLIPKVDRIKTNLNYTFLRAKDTETGDSLIYRPRHKAKIRLNFKIAENWDINWDGRYFSRRFTNKTNTRDLTGYFVANCNLTKRINDNTEFLFTVNNMFDKEYEEEEDYPMPRATVMAGFRLTM